jgi:fructose-bisphosphate aldolase class 1
MMSGDLERVALTLVADGKGILAADETIPTLTRRFDALAIKAARFAKWRAIIRIADALPSSTCVGANAHALERYTALWQEQGLVPIVEPEVLMDGSHAIERCEEVTGVVLHAVFNALFDQFAAGGDHCGMWGRSPRHSSQRDGSGHI